MNAIRIISALLLTRFLVPVFYIVLVITVGLYLLTAFLAAAFSEWWLLALTVLVPLTIVFVLISVTARFALQQILPQGLRREERTKLNGFIDTLFGIAERTKTPYPVLIFLISKDLIRGKESSFLRELLGDSKKVLNEFGEVKSILLTRADK